MPFTIERNDLAIVDADAIVVAANRHLQITGGVGLAVAQAAGFEEMQAACSRIGFCPCGYAVVTPAFGLSANIVVHAVGPKWIDGMHNEREMLEHTYQTALSQASAHGARRIALPLISAGTYGFPPALSLEVAREAIRKFLDLHEDADVRLVLYDRASVAAGIATYSDIAEYIDDNYVFTRPARISWRDTWDGDLILHEIDAATDFGEVRRDYDGEVDASPAPQANPIPSADYVPGPCMMSASAASPRPDLASAPTATQRPAQSPVYKASSSLSLKDMLDQLDAPFSDTLLALIDARGLTDAEVYKQANMSRQLFSKIRSDAHYRPTVLDERKCHPLV